MRKALAFVISLTLLIVTAPLLKAAEYLPPIDAILVLDVSLSMRTADPQRVANDAMVAFAEAMRMGVDRIGVISYAGHVVERHELAGIYCELCRYNLRNAIHNLDYASWTDHSAGLLAALEMLPPIDYESENRTHTIIFFTDGNLNVNPNLRTNAAAQADVEAAILEATARNIIIHTIGLNHDGNLDVDYLAVIASATGGLAFEAVYADEIPQIIDAIIAAKMMPVVAVEEVQEDDDGENEYEEDEKENYEWHEYRDYEDEYSPPLSQSWFPFIAAILGLLVLLLLVVRLRSPRRVFTGKLSITIDGKVSTVNLIEYGRRTTLAVLVPSVTNATLSHVLLLPCPAAPSHLPQLRIRSIGPTIYKDYMKVAAATARSGISLAADGEATILFDDFTIHLRYH